MQFKPFLLASLLAAFTYTGCGFVLNKAMGLKKMKPLSEIRIQQAAAAFGISASETYVLDTSWRTKFSEGLSRNGEPVKNEQHKNHLQPLQASYYNSAGQLVSFQINCYAGGFPNLNWTRDSIFDSFPPRLQAPVDTLLTCAEHLSYIKPLPGSKPPQTGSGHTVVIHWTRFMGRQTALFLETVRENLRRKAPAETMVIYVNCDNLYVE
ncbi:MAG: hypothetical protein IM638_02870 [Bacteroidetes bacterium]|nr:hypothetical protein [Bacteroidota bacterium]